MEKGEREESANRGMENRIMGAVEELGNSIVGEWEDRRKWRMGE